jgi:hypothetical protein
MTSPRRGNWGRAGPGPSPPLERASRSVLRSLDWWRARVVGAMPWVIASSVAAALDIGLVTLREGAWSPRGLGARCAGSGLTRFWIMARRIAEGAGSRAW